MRKDPTARETKAASVPAVNAEQFAIARIGAEQLAHLLALNVGRSGMASHHLSRATLDPQQPGRWRLATEDGCTRVSELEGVIVHWRASRRYWAQPYPETPACPDCVSHDGQRGRGYPGGVCGQCALTIFGTNENDRGQACREYRELFLVRRQDHLPLVVSLPPSSVAALRRYFLGLTRCGWPYYGVVTRLTLSPATNAEGWDYHVVRLAVQAPVAAEQAGTFAGIQRVLKPYLEPAAPADGSTGWSNLGTLALA